MNDSKLEKTHAPGIQANILVGHSIFVVRCSI